MLNTVFDGLDCLSNFNNKFRENIATPVLNKIPEKFNKGFIYSAFFTIATQIVYNSVNDFLPIIGTPAAFIFAFITGAIIQRNPCDASYKNFVEKHNMFSAFANGLYAIASGVIISQTNNTLAQTIGLIVTSFAHCSFAGKIEEKVQNGFDKLASINC